MNKPLAKARKRATPRLLPIEQMESLRLSGRQHSSDSNWLEATDIWQRVLELLPEDYEGRYRNAQALFHLGRIEQAAVEAGKAWQLSPQDPRPGVILGRAQHRLKTWEVAAQSWQLVATLDPRSFEAMFRLAQAQANLAHYAAAHDAAQRALALKPNDGETILLLQRVSGGYVAPDDRGTTEHLTALLAEAREFTNDKQWLEAEAAWSNYSKRAPREFEGFYRLAQACQAQNKIDKAIAAAKQAANINAADPRIQLLLARLFTAAPDFASAESYWWQVLATQPNDFEASYRLGQCMLELYNLTNAKKWLTKAKALRPDHEGVALLLSRANSRGNVERGRQSKEKKAAVIPTNTILDQVQLGRRLLQEKDWKNAESCWWYVLSHRPDDFEACYRLGQCLLEQGNLNDAKKWLTLAQSLHADHEGLVLLLSRVRARENLLRRSQPAQVNRAAVSADKLLDQVLAGRKLIQDKNWDAAEAIWWQVLAQKPNDFEANYRLGQCLLEIGNASEAKKWLTEARKLRPDHENVALLLSRLLSRERVAGRKQRPSRKKLAAPDTKALTAIAQSPLEDAREATAVKDWLNAVKCWTEVITHQQENFEGFYRLAQAHYELGDMIMTLAHSTRANELRPHHTSNLTFLGRALQRTNALNESIVIWEEILAKTPGQFEAHFRMGQCFASLGQLEKAEEQFVLAQQLRPDSLNCHMYRTAQVVKLGRLDEAIADWRIFLQDYAQDSRSKRKFVAFLKENKRSDLAEPVLHEILSEKPDDLDGLYQLASYLVDERRWTETLELLGPIVDKMNDDSELLKAAILRTYAVATDSLGNLAEADRSFRESLVLDPESASAITRLARISRQLGKPDEAVALRRRACGLTPNDIGNWHELIFLLASLERETEAREALVKAESILPPTAATLARFGRICESALFLDDATRYFSMAMVMDPSTVLHAGQYYARNGIVDKALEYLTTARETNDTSVETAKALIAQLRICELFGMTPEELKKRPRKHELLAPELLFEHMVESSLAQPTYQPVRGRVVLITGSLGAGGAERQLVTTIRGLVKHPDVVESITLLAVSLNKRFKRDFYLGDIENLPVTIRSVEDEQQKPSLSQSTIPFPTFVDAFPDDMRDAIKIWYHDFIKHKPEVVHAWQDFTCLTAVIAAALAGVPRIMLSTRSVRPDNPRRRLKRFMQRGFKAVMQLPNVSMLNNSKAGASDYEDWLDLPAGTIKVIYNGIDFDRLLHAAEDKETAAHRKQLRIPKTSPVMGGVFRMSEEKRPLLWIETAAEVLKLVPDAHFVIAGDGPMRDDMVERAQQLGVAHRLHLPGHVQIASWFKLMDVVLLTSRMEGLPNVLLEAQSFGIPVVAPAVGGVPETILQNKTGWAVPAATAKKMAEKIAHAMLKKDWYQKAQSQASSFAKDNFSVEAMVNKTLAAYGLVEKSSLVTANTKPLNETDGLQLAQQAFRRKEFDVAATHLATAIRIDPCNTEAWRWLGRTQQGMGAVPQAIASWRRVLALQPEDFEALFRLAEQLSHTGDDSTAVLLLRRPLLLNTEHDGTLRLLARLLQRTGQSQEAFMLWGLVRTKHPTDFEAAYRGGQLALVAGDDAQARELLTLAIQLDASQFEPVELLARHLIWSAELGQARKLLMTYLLQNKDSFDAMTLLGTVLTLQGRQPLMQRWLAVMQRQAPRKVAASLRCARWLLAFGEYEKCTSLLNTLKPGTDAERNQQRLLHITAVIRQCDFAQAASLCEDEPPAEFRTLKHDYANTMQLLGSTGNSSSVQNAFLVWWQHKCKLVRTPVYEPVERSVLHVVNSLAMGGTEKQSAITAAMQTASPHQFGPITLLRVDPSQNGRAVFFLPYVNSHNVKTGTLDELAGTNKTATPLDALITNSHFRNAMGIAEIERLYRAFIHLKPAVVHVWTPQTAVQCAIAGLLAGVPRIVLRMGSVAPDERPLVTSDESIRYEWFRQVLKQAVKDKRIRLVANCERNLRGWLAWIGANPKKTGTTPMVTYNIIDVDQLGIANSKQVNALRTRLKIRPMHKVIGSVTRFEPEKGMDLWLDCVELATAQMPNAVFLLVGNGRLRNELKRKIDKRNLGKHVRIVTDAGSALAPYYSVMDVFLQTSLVEGLPNAALEAVAFNIPIVVTDVGGTSEAVAGYRKATLVNCEAKEIVDCLNTTISAQSDARDLAPEESIKSFSVAAILQQLHDAYDTNANTTKRM